MKIGNLEIAKNSKPIIIAELAQSHCGSYQKIFKYIDKLSSTGVDVVKFQTHYASQLLMNHLKNFFKSIKIDLNIGKNEFSKKKWHKIKRHCESKNIIFLSSPFSIKAVKILKEIGMNAWKIGSGEFFSDQLLNYIIKFKQPILLSTGLANFNEIDKKIKQIRSKNKNIVLMQCTSEYPSNINRVGINVLNEFKKKYNVFLGLSDHSGSIIPSICALNIGAKIIEVHVKLDGNRANPDFKSSIDLKMLNFLCNARDEIYSMSRNPLKKFVSKEQLKIKFFTSCALNRIKKEL